MKSARLVMAFVDQLAQGGARLEKFYAQPMCTPSRAALLTGRYPHRYGLQTLVIPSAGTYGLATDEWLLPQALKAVSAPSLAPGHGSRTRRCR